MWLTSRSLYRVVCYFSQRTDGTGTELISKCFGEMKNAKHRAESPAKNELFTARRVERSSEIRLSIFFRLFRLRFRELTSVRDLISSENEFIRVLYALLIGLREMWSVTQENKFMLEENNRSRLKLVRTSFLFTFFMAQRMSAKKPFSIVCSGLIYSLITSNDRRLHCELNFCSLRPPPPSPLEGKRLIENFCAFVLNALDCL